MIVDRADDAAQRGLYDAPCPRLPIVSKSLQIHETDFRRGLVISKPSIRETVGTGSCHSQIPNSMVLAGLAKLDKPVAPKARSVCCHTHALPKLPKRTRRESHSSLVADTYRKEFQNGRSK
jgi:hypothetical protein